MRELPDSWSNKTLLEVVGDKNESIVGGPFGSNLKVSDYLDQGVPILRLQNIGWRRFINKDIRFISEDKAKELNYHSFKPGDLALAKLGDPIGKTCIIPESIGGGIVVSDVVRIRNESPNVDTRYLMHVLNSPISINQLNKQVFGTTRPRINLEQVRNLIIPIPPLDTQRKIVAILDKAEEIRRMRARANELTQTLLQSVFLEMFGDPISNPMRWEKRPLGEFGRIITGNTPSRKVSEYYGDYIEWIKTDNIEDNFTYLTKSAEGLSKAGAIIGRIAPKGSVLVTCIAGSLSSIGRAGIANRDVTFNQQINAVVPDEMVDSIFLYHLIKNSKKAIQNASTHSMKGMISKSDFASISLILPPKELQEAFASRASFIESISLCERVANDRANALSDSLINNAFTGELVA